MKVLVFWLALLSTSGPLWAADVTLVSDTSLSSEGYFVLTWNASEDSDSPVVLQRSRDVGFPPPAGSPADSSDTIEYDLLANGQITITGLEDGTYYFRARQENGRFSEPIAVEVRHHSLGRALSFFLVGLALFITLTITIIRGNRSLDEKSSEAANAG